MKVDENVKKSVKLNKVKKKVETPKERKKNIVPLIIAVILFLVVLIILNIAFNNMRYARYEKYEEKMNIYGFNNIYDNGSAKTNESLTKMEAVKMVISSIYNYSNFDSFYFYPSEANEQEAIDLLVDKGIVDNSTNYNKRVKYIDVLTYFLNAKSVYLGESITDYTGEIKNISKFSLDEQAVIKDMVANNIIELDDGKLPFNDYIVKGMLNEIVVNFVEKYNTITVNRDRININPEKLPSNYNEYPYTLAAIDKSVYEKENVSIDHDYRTSVQIFSELKEEYHFIDELVKKYTDTILNVDYMNIDKNKFKEDIRSLSLFNIQENELDRYFDYVEKNKIQISGSAKVQFPAIYYDGMMYRVRTKIELKIKSANELTNLLFKDVGQSGDVKYEANNITTIIDIPLSRYYNTMQLAVYVGPLFPSKSTPQEAIDSEEELTGVW